MSTVVVVRKGENLCMAADAGTCFGDKRMDDQLNANPGKVLHLGPCVVGVVGSVAHTLVLESLHRGASPMPEIATRLQAFEFMRSIHPRLKEDYFLNPHDAPTDPYESSQVDVLIMSRHGIFGVLSLREAYEYTRYWSLGSGADFALGAMSAVYDDSLTAEQIAVRGIEAALKFDTGTFATKVVTEGMRLT